MHSSDIFDGSSLHSSKASMGLGGVVSFQSDRTESFCDIESFVDALHGVKNQISKFIGGQREDKYALFKESFYRVPKKSRVFKAWDLLQNRHVKTPSPGILSNVDSEISVDAVHRLPLNTDVWFSSADFFASSSAAVQRITPIQSVLKKIRSVAAYEQGWDGYGSKPISRNTLRDAEIFSLNALSSPRLNLPKISPASDGELAFLWKNDNGVIDLGFYGDGEYSLYARLADGQELFLDEVDLTSKLPSSLSAIIYN